MDDHTLEEMKAKFGEEETADYIMLAKATRSLVHLWEVYAQSPVNSPTEKASAAALNRMMKGLEARPAHATGMIESLLALIAHLRHGGSYEQWFLSLNLSPTPGGDD
jgi:hypothetical protein